MATPVALGSFRLDADHDFTVTIRDGSGNPVAFTGAETLAARLWRPRGLASCTLAAAWATAAAGTITLSIDAAALAAASIAPGTWSVEVTPTSGGRPLEGLTGTITLLEAAPPAYLATPGWSIGKAERLLCRARGAWLALCGMDDYPSGVNEDLCGPIGAAIEFFGGTVSDPTRLADSDLATVADPRKVVEVADFLLARSIVGNQDSVTMQDAAGRMAAWSDWSRRAEVELARLEAHVRRAYGYGLRRSRPRVAPLAAGSAWPPAPPPPAGIGPYPPGSGPDPDATFNP